MRFLTILYLLLLSPLTWAEEIHVAVAANFLEPLKKLATIFQTETQHSIKISSGSTGQLYAQIKHGAPFDIFLAADTKRPKILVSEDIALPESLFVYAQGQLVLWSKQSGLFENDQAQAIAFLKKADFNHFAVGNVKTAPYGTAAKQVLDKLDLWSLLNDKIVQGANVGQTYQFVATESAEIGFIALSHHLAKKDNATASYWIVDNALYDPIQQAGVILKRTAHLALAQQFMTFLQSDTAKTHIQTFGYHTLNDRHAN